MEDKDLPKTISTLTLDEHDQIAKIIAESFIGRDHPRDIYPGYETFASKQELIDAVSKVFKKGIEGEHLTLYFLVFQRGEDWITPAIVGNGPNAEANARFFQMAASWLPNILAEVIGKTWLIQRALIRVGVLREKIKRAEVDVEEIFVHLAQIQQLLEPGAVPGSRLPTPVDAPELSMIPPEDPVP